MNRIHGERGAVLAIVGVSLVALIGMAALAVDLGRLYAARSRAQDICDAAALAGGAYLDGKSVQQPIADRVAGDLAAANVNARSGWPIYDAADGDTAGVDTYFPQAETESWTVNGKTITVEQGKAIRVDGWVEVEFGLARIFNVFGGSHNTGRAHAVAVAILEPARKVKGPDPVGVDEDHVDTYEYGEDYVLRVSTWDEGGFGSGNFCLLNLGNDQGGNDVRNRLALDDKMDEVSVAIGDMIDTKTGLTGGVGGPVTQGIEERLAQSYYKPDVYPSGSFDLWAAADYKYDSRILLVPILRVDNAHGTESVLVTGFSIFYIDSYNPDTKELTGIFLEAVYEGDSYQYFNPEDGEEIPNDGGVLSPVLIA